MAFKMKGHSLPGPNQRKDGKSKKQIAYEMSEEHGGKPGFQEFLDKTFGGPTTIEGSVTHTKKDSPAKQTKFPRSPGARKRKIKKWIKSSQKVREVMPDGPVGPSPSDRRKAEIKKALIAEIKKRRAEGTLPKEQSPAKQTKFPNSPGAKKRKKKKFIKKVTKMMKKGRRDDWQPAFPGADHSIEELKKMTKKQKEDYYN